MPKNLSAWERVEIARNSNRKTALDYIEKIFDEFIELQGDRLYGEDASIVCGLATRPWLGRISFCLGT